MRKDYQGRLDLIFFKINWLKKIEHIFDFFACLGRLFALKNIN